VDLLQKEGPDKTTDYVENLKIFFQSKVKYSFWIYIFETILLLKICHISDSSYMNIINENNKCDLKWLHWGLVV